MRGPKCHAPSDCGQGSQHLQPVCRWELVHDRCWAAQRSQGPQTVRRVEGMPRQETLAPAGAGRQLAPAWPLLLAGLVALAFVLRFWRLGDWNFQATEMFTLRDSLHPRLTNPRPLGYLLNYLLVRPVMPLDELGLRVLPALFGALAIPALYFMGRRIVGPRAAFLAALLLTV